MRTSYQNFAALPLPSAAELGTVFKVHRTNCVREAGIGAHLCLHGCTDLYMYNRFASHGLELHLLLAELLLQTLHGFVRYILHLLGKALLFIR